MPEHTFLPRARALLLLAEAASQHDLPDPRSTTAYSVPDRISLHFDSLADLTAWAEWADEPIAEHLYRGTIQHRVDEAQIYEIPLSLAYVERASAEAIA